MTSPYGRALDFERLPQIAGILSLIDLVDPFLMAVAVGVTRMIVSVILEETLFLHPFIVEDLAEITASVVGEKRHDYIGGFELMAEFEYGFHRRPTRIAHH